MKKKNYFCLLVIGVVGSIFGFSSLSYANDNFGAIEFYEVSSTSEPVDSSSSTNFSETFSTSSDNSSSSTEQPVAATTASSSSTESTVVAAAVVQKPSGMQPSLGELQKMGITIGGFLVILLVLIGFWVRNRKRSSHK